MKLFTLSLAIICLLSAQTALASTVVRTGDRILIDDQQSVAGNFYAIGNSVTISGESTEDLTMVGGRVQVTGAVAQDILSIGVTNDIDGQVFGDVRVLGGDVRVSGSVAGDVVVVGAVVEILPEATIGGDVLVYGGMVTVDGEVVGDVLGRMEQLAINSSVQGDVDVTVANLSLGELAAIDGNVVYVSNSLLSQALNATIGGDVVRNDPVYLGGTQSHLQSVGVLFLVSLLTSLVWYFLSRTTLARVAGHTLKLLPRSAITGVIALFITPLIIAVLILSYLGSLLAGVLLFGFCTLILLSLAALPAVVGQLTMKVFSQPAAQLTPLAILVGSVCSSIVLLFPFVGVFLVVFMVVVVLGGLIELLIRASR